MSGAALGIALALMLAGPSASPFLLASLGGSAVFLFGLTRAPAVQPRALIGGHVGANPLIMVHSHAGFSALWQPVLLGVLSLAAVAFVWSRLLPGQFRYPLSWMEKSPPTPFWGGWPD